MVYLTEKTYQFSSTDFKVWHLQRDFQCKEFAISFAKQLKRKRHVKGTITIEGEPQVINGRVYWNVVAHI